MKIKYPEYSEIEIICKIPDINITFIYPNGKETKHKIELKSSKKIHCSTIKNLDINQMLIYCFKTIYSFISIYSKMIIIS